MTEITQSLSIFRDTVYETVVVSLAHDEHTEGRTTKNVYVKLNWGTEIDSPTFYSTVDGSLRFADNRFIITTGTRLNYSVGGDKRILNALKIEISYKLEKKYRVEGCYCSNCGKLYPYAKPSASFKCWECSNPAK